MGGKIRAYNKINGGVFACKLKYVLQKAHELLDFTDYYDLYAKYETLEKISFDYAHLRQIDNVNVDKLLDMLHHWHYLVRN